MVDSTAAGAWDQAAVMVLDSHLLRIGGTRPPLGLPPNKWRFDASLTVFRELTLKGSYTASRGSIERMMAVVEESGARSHLTVIPFEDVAGAIDVYQDKALQGRLAVKLV